MGFENLSVTQWDIVRLFVAGNVEEGTKLLKKYSRAMREYLGLRGFRNDADDIMQGAYMKIVNWVKREGFDQDKGTFRGMIVSCLHQAICDHLRKNGRPTQALELEVVSKSDLSVWSEVYFETLLAQTLASVKTRVDETTWLAFVAMNQEGKSAEEVAEQFRRDAQWAYDVKARIKKMIKDILKGLDLDA